MTRPTDRNFVFHPLHSGLAYHGDGVTGASAVCPLGSGDCSLALKAILLLQHFDVPRLAVEADHIAGQEDPSDKQFLLHVPPQNRSLATLTNGVNNRTL